MLSFFVSLKKKFIFVPKKFCGRTSEFILVLKTELGKNFEFIFVLNFFLQNFKLILVLIYCCIKNVYLLKTNKIHILS